MRLLPLGLLLLCSALGSPDVLAFTCADRFRQFVREIPVHVEHTTTLDRFPSDKVEFIGEGIGGGRVYLVTPHQGGEAFVIKDYIYGDRYDTTNDVIGLQLLKEIAKRNAKPKQIRPVEVLDRVDDRVLKLEHAKGTDVHRLAAAANIETRAKLARLFRRQLESVQHNLRVGSPIHLGDVEYAVLGLDLRASKTVGFKDLIVTLRKPNQPSNVSDIKLWIKPENVVMTANGEFIIIDPR